MKIKTYISVAFLLISTVANGKSLEQMQAELKRAGTQIESFDVGAFALISIKGQNPVLISGDGRYMIEGEMKIIDRFSLREINSAAGLRSSKKVIHLEAVIDNPEIVTSGFIGNNKNERSNLLIINPLNPASKNVIRKAERLYKERGEQFRIVFGVINEQLKNIVVQQHCHFEQISWPSYAEKIGKELQGLTTCESEDKIHHARQLTYMLGVKQFPYMITKNNIVHQGDSVAYKMEDITSK
ncbi:hypothetical protein A3715_18990 [Oleiphilus sp. HI0009]|nr:hypothetical protein A3715_18990 [Oleiphilus sp. HI0009]